MQAVQFAKIDNADAKVTGCENANCGDVKAWRTWRKDFSLFVHRKHLSNRWLPSVKDVKEEN